MTSGETIAMVLARFLAEQEQRLSSRTIARYRDVIELLHHFLNSYGYECLDPAATGRYEALRAAPGGSQREFCEVMGPEHILPGMDEFLGYFMVRKVMASKELGRAAGTVTKRLAAWLAEQGYVRAETAKAAMEQSARAADELPRTRELASRLEAHVEAAYRGEPSTEVEDHFRITRVEPGAIWLEGMLDGRELGPISSRERSARAAAPAGGSPA